MPIALDKKEWERIARWTDRDREDPDIVRKREYVKYLDETSKEMTKSWPNSVENVNKRNEELRRARIEAAEQANTKFYRRYVKRKKEEQQRLMYSARDTIFKNKDAPKLLLSAVIETAVQKERQEQLNFKHERQRQQAEQKRKDDDNIIRKSKEWHELMALRRKRRFDVNKQHQKDILDQAHEVADRNRNEYETELNLQKADNIMADEQMAAIRDFEENFHKAEKARIFTDMERAKKEVDDSMREKKARDEMDNKLLEVLLKSRNIIEQKRKQTEKDIKAQQLMVLEKISQKLESGDAAREAKEQAILNKAIKEKEDIAEARRVAEQRKREQFKQDRIDVRNNFLAEERQRLQDLDTMRQWEIMNRFKNAEIYADFQEGLRQEKERKIKEHREELLRLWKEREERETRETNERRYFYGELAERKLRDADDRLLTHAAALVQEARAHGRPERPLLRAVDKYCKLYRLYPMPELPRSMQEHFPRYRPTDGSLPTPGYRAPTPPPPPAADDADIEPRRDGVHDPQSGPSNPKKTDVTTEDYKRAGPANGLQRKNE